MDARGLRDNTLIFYIFGDNGSSAEGQQGSISELLAQNNIPNTVEQQIAALDRIGGLDALGPPRTDNMYHAGWAWAGGTPFKGTKLLAAYFGGTRNPMVVSWPGHIAHDGVMRAQFHHVIDIAPTIYDVLDITPPEVVNGFEQLPIDGTSLAYTFADADAPRTASTSSSSTTTAAAASSATAGSPAPSGRSSRGTRRARRSASPTWDSANDVWELYDLEPDFSQAHDLAAERSREARGDEGALPRGRRGEQGLPDRRRQLAAAASGGSDRLALHELDLRAERPPDAGVRRARRRPAVDDGDDRRRVRRERQRRALRGRRRRRRAVRLHGRRASWSTNTT